MAFDSKGLDDYIDVAQRIAEFRVKHPEGSLQPLNPAQPFEIRELAGTDKNGKEQRGTFIIYTAAAYRSPDDQRPGVGCAYEVFPGRTPYTAGSELQNAETAAWGRAIVAVLAADTRAGIASQQEVRNRQAERGQPENSEPARPQHPASTLVDPDAQAFAEEAHKATGPDAIEDIHRRARKAGKVTALVRNPAGGTGKPGQLAVYLDWRRKQLGKTTQLDADDPWAAKIEEISNETDASSALVEIYTLLSDGQIEDARAEIIITAILAKFPNADETRAVA